MSFGADTKITVNKAQLTQLKSIVKDAWDIFDADGSGDLDTNELEDLMNEICETLCLPLVTKPQLQDIIKILDTSGDGTIELRELMKNLPKVNEVLSSSEYQDALVNETQKEESGEIYNKKNKNFIKGLGKKIALMERLNAPAEGDKKKPVQPLNA